MNWIMAREASDSLDTFSNATLDGQGSLRKPGSGPYMFDPRRADHDVGLLDTDIEIAPREIFYYRAVVHQHGLGLKLVGNAKLRNALGRVRAAASARIADRISGKQCRFVALHR